MIRKIESELRDFKIGAEQPRSGKMGTRNLTVSQASRAVGSHFVKNFFERLKLFFGVGEKKEWFRNKSISGRLDRLGSTDLHQLNKLFNLCYPDEQKVDDKKLFKLMNQFVRPKIYEDGLAKFFKGADQTLYNFPKNNKIALNNILKLTEAGIDLQALKLQLHLSDDPGTIDFNFLTTEEAGRAILEGFGLTPTYANQLENFATHPVLQTELFQVLPDAAKENLAKMIAYHTTDAAFARFIKPDAKTDEIPQIIHQNLEDQSLVANFLLTLTQVQPEQFDPDTLKPLQMFSSDKEFQRKLYATLSDAELKNLIMLTDAGITAAEFAAFVRGKPSPKKMEKTVLENLQYADTVEDCVKVLTEKKFSQEMSEAMFATLKESSKTEENKNFLQTLFGIPPISAAKKRAFLASEDPHLAENIIEAISYNFDFDNPLHYERLQKFLSAHPNIPTQDPLEALTTHFQIFKEELHK